MLFVCSGNTGRSVAAEALTRTYLQSQGLSAEVASRGLAVDPAHNLAEAPAQTLLSGRGIDVSGHRARSLTTEDIEAADLILCATRAHRDQIAERFPSAQGKAYALADYAGFGGDLEDAFGKPVSAYAAMLTQLELQIPAALAHAFDEFEVAPR